MKSEIEWTEEDTARRRERVKSRTEGEWQNIQDRMSARYALKHAAEALSEADERFGGLIKNLPFDADITKKWLLTRRKIQAALNMARNAL